jgi:tetratricopeptide (TPR) repeat protein
LAPLVLAALLSADAALPKAVAQLGNGPPSSPNTPGQGNNPRIGPDRTVPGTDYFMVMRELEEGEYKDAYKHFSDTWRGALKDVDGRWIDSICHHAMIGESLYRMGQTGEALDHYTQAINLFLRYPTWLIRVQWDSVSVTPSGQATNLRPVPWGKSRRKSRPGHIPDKMAVGIGNIDNSDVVRRGGVVRNPYLRPVVGAEIVRATALAIRRRREILGPVCRHDALTAKLLSTFSQSLTPQRHWSESWVALEAGLAYASFDQTQQALEALKRAEVVGGQFDHPLTSVALFEQGRLMLEANKLEEAADFFLEASYAAFHYPDLTVLEEALRYGHIVHLISGKKGVYPPLVAAAQWARVKSYRELEVSLAVCLAEAFAANGQTNNAKEWLGTARKTMANRSIQASRIGARWQLQTAVASYQAGSDRAGAEALAGALKFQRMASNRLFQIRIADDRAPKLSPRMAMILYGKVLAETTSTAWASDPLESLAVMTTPHEQPFENWFTVAYEAKHHEDAVQIAEWTRRHRFFSTLELGGRMMALRWLLEGPDDVLDEKAVVQRQDLFGRYPQYAKLSAQVKKMRTELRATTLVPVDPDAVKKQRDLLAQLAKAGEQQEVILHEMALRREPVAILFPPVKKLADIQRALPSGHALWVFFATQKGDLYSFMFNNSQYDVWRVASVDRLKKLLPQLLQTLGNHSASGELSFAPGGELATSQSRKAGWRQHAAQIRDALIEGSRVDLAVIGEELTIVPDGALWYLPFETLPVGPAENSVCLISRNRVRYSAFASLAVPFRRTPTRLGSVVLAPVAKLHPQQQVAGGEAAVVDLKRVVPAVTGMTDAPAVPTPTVAKLADALIVLAEIDPPPAEKPYEWAPVPLDRSRANGALEHWFTMPWGGPEIVVLPGYRTSAETGLKGKNAGNGRDLFLASCGLLSTGARTILISRWRVGGKTANDLVREFVQELPHTSPADAWQRSVQLLMESTIDPTAEPRVRGVDENLVPKAEHPFFWAGYLLVDSGAARVGDEPAAPPKPVGPVVRAPDAGGREPAPVE